jgi:hypothetical protein
VAERCHREAPALRTVDSAVVACHFPAGA